MEEFITECLIKEKEKFINLKKSNKKEINNERISDKNNPEETQEQYVIEEKVLSPKKNIIENCLIF